MTEDDLAAGAHDALGMLKKQRGPCPPAETLVEYEALAAPDREHRPEHAHIQICSRCQLLLLHMAEPQPASQDRPWPAGALKRAGGWFLPLAAAAVLAVGLSLVDWRSDRGTPVDTVRGSDIQAIAPAGTVAGVSAFSWQSPIRSDRYRITVRRGADQVWQAVSGTTRIIPPPAIFEKGVEYTWQIEAIDRDGVVRMVSPPQSFTLGDIAKPKS
jgi:hypothetical protein